MTLLKMSSRLLFTLSVVLSSFSSSFAHEYESLTSSRFHTILKTSFDHSHLHACIHTSSGL